MRPIDGADGVFAAFQERADSSFCWAVAVPKRWHLFRSASATGGPSNGESIDQRLSSSLTALGVAHESGQPRNLVLRN